MSKSRRSPRSGDALVMMFLKTRRHETSNRAAPIPAISLIDGLCRGDHGTDELAHPQEPGIAELTLRSLQVQAQQPSWLKSFRMDTPPSIKRSLLWTLLKCFKAVVQAPLASPRAKSVFSSGNDIGRAIRENIRSGSTTKRRLRLSVPPVRGLAERPSVSAKAIEPSSNSIGRSAIGVNCVSDCCRFGTSWLIDHRKLALASFDFGNLRRERNSSVFHLNARSLTDVYNLCLSSLLSESRRNLEQDCLGPWTIGFPVGPQSLASVALPYPFPGWPAFLILSKPSLSGPYACG